MLKITFQWLVNDESRWFAVVCSFDSPFLPLCFSLYSWTMCNVQSVVPRVPSRRVYNDWYDPGCRSRASASRHAAPRQFLLVRIITDVVYAIAIRCCTRQVAFSELRFPVSILRRLGFDMAQAGWRCNWETRNVYSFVNWSAMSFARRLTLWYETQSL